MGPSRAPTKICLQSPPPYWRIYVPVNWVIIGSGNGLSPIQRQTIIWTNPTNWNLGNKLQWNLTDRYTNFSSAKMHLKMSPWPFCPGWVSAPSHHLNQCWIIVNWAIRNKLQWNFNRNPNIFMKKKYAWKCCLQNGVHLFGPSMS